MTTIVRMQLEHRRSVSEMQPMQCVGDQDERKHDSEHDRPRFPERFLCESHTALLQCALSAWRCPSVDRAPTKPERHCRTSWMSNRESPSIVIAWPPSEFSG